MKGLAAVLAGLIAIPASAETLFTQTNLVTDNQAALAAEGFGPAAFVDPNLINPWGISRGPTTPWWVSNQGSGTSTLHNGVQQEQINNDGMAVHIFGNAAVVTGVYRDKGVEKGKPFLRRGRFTDTWVYRNGAWQCVASQSTLINH